MKKFFIQGKKCTDISSGKTSESKNRGFTHQNRGVKNNNNQNYETMHLIMCFAYNEI